MKEESDKPGKDNLTGKRDVVFVYQIYLTPIGKGYGCFALKRNSKDSSSYLVGASFCHPLDGSRFNKKIAREKALSRISSEKEFVLDREEKNTTYIVGNILKKTACLIEYIPLWAKNAYDFGLYVYKLELDNMSKDALLKEVIKYDKTIREKYLRWVAHNYEIVSSKKDLYIEPLRKVRFY
jgi:hypothetical protein